MCIRDRRHPGLGRRGVACGRGRRTATAATDFHGDTGRGLEEGPQSAEADDQDKAEMAAWLQHGAAAWTPRPVKRVFIPKAGGKRRGLGIPVIADRCLQAQVSAALEPEWEARFESRSYGFRPGRSCQDAMQSIFVTARGTTCKRQWVLDADVAAALDVCSYCFLPDCHGWNRACWGVGG